MRRLSALLAFLLAAGCGGPDGREQNFVTEELRTFEAAEQPPPPGSPTPARPAEAPDSAAPERLPVSLPRIAYTYGYTFRLSADAVPRVQERHVEMCHSLGPARCRIVNLERNAARGDYLTASTRLQVAAPIARAFGQRLAASATDAGAETIDRSISGEDLSRQMVDAEARIRTREALIRRLTVLLETRSGNIQQAVEAERAINAAQEELEASRAWLAEMRTRVDMSTFDLNYQSGVPLGGGVGEPLRDAWGEVGPLFSRSLALLVLLVGALLPWALVALAIFHAVRWLRRRRERAEALEAAPPPEEEAPPVS